MANKEWIKNFWANYKETHNSDSLWSRVSEMMGYLEEGGGEGGVPVGADCTLSTLPAAPGASQGGSAPAESPVKRVVCSPDLPVFPAGQAKPTPPPPDSSTADPDKAFQCSYCSKMFDSKTAFQSHVRCHSKDTPEDPYQCNFCGKTFAVPARLTRHYRTHTGEKPYQCEYCKKSFSVKENLSVHRRIHTKERPYKCDICERAFEHSGKLHRHMRIHTGERPHKCSICSKTFIQSGQLVIHMRTHTGEKPYVCRDCGKGFTCSKQLKVHTRTHTGEKPYSCDICGKSFGYNHVLKLHQVAHYGEKVYKCTICNETFTSKKTMEAHIKSHSESSGAREDGGGGTETEVSCASSTGSDKENSFLFGQPGAEAGGLDPALLAAVAVASRAEPPLGTPFEPSVCLMPDPLASLVRREPPEEEPLLTPPSSAPVSPPSSPEFILPDVDHLQLILPPRKRSKAILKSMEDSLPAPPPPQRYSSVIQYARAS